MSPELQHADESTFHEQIDSFAFIRVLNALSCFICVFSIRPYTSSFVSCTMRVEFVAGVTAVLVSNDRGGVRIM